MKKILVALTCTFLALPAAAHQARHGEHQGCRCHRRPKVEQAPQEQPAIGQLRQRLAEHPQLRRMLMRRIMMRRRILAGMRQGRRPLLARPRGHGQGLRRMPPGLRNAPGRGRGLMMARRMHFMRMLRQRQGGAGAPVPPGLRRSGRRQSGPRGCPQGEPGGHHGHHGKQPELKET